MQCNEQTGALIKRGKTQTWMLQGQYKVLGDNVAKIRTDLMKEQLATFRSQLEEFARKHKVKRYYAVGCRKYVARSYPSSFSSLAE